jgi:hypothetical protein
VKNCPSFLGCCIVKSHVTALLNNIYPKQLFFYELFMKNSTKASLISALVFPGAGHFYQKKYLRGIVLFSISTASICFIISKTVERTLQVVEKIQSRTVEPDVAAIMQAVSSQTDSAYLLEIATAIFLICWVIGIIDSYRVGGVGE